MKHLKRFNESFEPKDPYNSDLLYEIRDIFQEYADEFNIEDAGGFSPLSSSARSHERDGLFYVLEFDFEIYENALTVFFVGRKSKEEFLKFRMKFEEFRSRLTSIGYNTKKISDTGLKDWPLTRFGGVEEDDRTIFGGVKLVISDEPISEAVDTNQIKDQQFWAEVWKDDINDVLDIFQPYADEYFLKRELDDSKSGKDDFFMLYPDGIKYRSGNTVAGILTLKIFLTDPVKRIDDYPGNRNRKVDNFGSAKGPLDQFLTRLEKVGYDCELREYANYWLIHIICADIEIDSGLLDRVGQEVKNSSISSK